jgi:hypothetical protein
MPNRSRRPRRDSGSATCDATLACAVRVLALAPGFIQGDGDAAGKVSWADPSAESTAARGASGLRRRCSVDDSAYAALAGQPISLTCQFRASFTRLRYLSPKLCGLRAIMIL